MFLFISGEGGLGALKPLVSSRFNLKSDKK
ncbi:rCG48522, isoform CRA_b [Rattus norvegicus]|uniref:RCG48522, isoform CRA_b n=1 Tax=Rattus norvegicus TaxID=10116 RepID=A6HZA2_RAT|nr:rCG48522, isoform CRA_b [Rattus norvegicus]